MEIESPIPELEIRQITHQALSSLSYMHSRDLVHRDIKPWNMLYNNDGRVQLCDFGVARSLAQMSDTKDSRRLRREARKLSGTSNQYMSGLTGTMVYMPPEVLIRNQEYSQAVDIWAIGCVVAQMYLRTILFDGASPQEVMQQILYITGSPKVSSTYPSRDNMIAALGGLSKPRGNPLKSVKENLQAYFAHLAMQAEEHNVPVTRISVNALDFIAKCLTFDPKDRPTADQLLVHPFLRTVPVVPIKVSKSAAALRGKSLFLPLDHLQGCNIDQYRLNVIRRSSSPGFAEFIHHIDTDPEMASDVRDEAVDADQDETVVPGWFDVGTPDRIDKEKFLREAEEFIRIRELIPVVHKLLHNACRVQVLTPVENIAGPPPGFCPQRVL
jgi:serine/threonine protein kinase